jgi:hypothetical protein
VKIVLPARPLHQLLISEALVWLLDDMEKSFRGFFWAAKDRENGGQFPRQLGTNLQTPGVWRTGYKKYETSRIGTSSQVAMDEKNRHVQALTRSSGDQRCAG